MISCDNIIENKSIFLENLDINSSASWVSGTSGAYAFYHMYYKTKVVSERTYYYRATYKFTTTNQIPEWVQIYSQNGSRSTSARLTNLIAGTEYTLSGYGVINSNATNNNGSLYNGPSNAINGVVGYAKNTLVYDVTELFQVLKALNIITNNTQLVTWCDENLEYKEPGVIYDITTKINNINKIVIDGGSLICEPVECDGMQFYCAKPEYRTLTYFDTAFSPLAQIYNNKSNGSVTLTTVSAKDQNSPFFPEHQNVLKIETKGEASPGTGGFYSSITGAANKLFLQKFVAKIPVGYTLNAVGNTPTTNVVYEWLSSREGTGEWEEYTILRRYASNGTFSVDGHIYLMANSGYTTTSVTWYIAYMNTCDITGNEELKYYSALPNKEILKGTKVFSKEFNTANLIPNGTFTDSGMTLPTGIVFDDTDYAGNAKRSVVQPVGNVGFSLFGPIRINAQTKYKLSYWVKCKGDMSNFLTAIGYYNDDNVLLEHHVVHYLNGTRTTLTQDLVSGATQMTVSSNKNWIAKGYDGVGFRNYATGYNNFGTFEHTNKATGVVSGVSGSNIVLFKIPYTGATIAKGNYVVESYRGNNYVYPMNKSMLPKDNTWKYLEGYFGSESFSGSWDGVDSMGSWPAIPKDATYMILKFNIYQNDGTVPIKFSDIKIEEVGTSFGDGNRRENKIQFKKYN